MGNWIKENKFEAGLLVLVILIAGAAFFFGSKKGQLYAIHKEGYDSAASKVKQYQGKRPSPTSSNAKVFEEQVDDYRAVIEGLQDKMVAYRPDELTQIAPPDFIDNLNAARAQVTQALAASGIEYPEDDFHLGFEKYTTAPPPDEATAYLGYQLEALGALYKSLIAAKPSALINVYREELPVEKGQPMEGGGAETPASGSRSRSSRSRSAVPATAPPYYRLPLELTFQATEPAARRFIADVSSNKEYFFVIRSLRIQNEKRDKAPQKDDVEFDDAPADFGDDTFGTSFDDVIPENDAPGDPTDPAEPAVEEELPAIDEQPTGQQILGQVLGAEKIYVFLELDLILFKAKGEEPGQVALP